MWKLSYGNLSACVKQKFYCFEDSREPLAFFCVSKSMNQRKYPASIYLLKVNSRNTRARCEICSELTIKIPD